MVGSVFLSEKFGRMVGTYECHLLLCECRWGGDSTWRWWDTSTLHYVIEIVFCDLVWWGHKNLVYTVLKPLLLSHPLGWLVGGGGGEGRRVSRLGGHRGAKVGGCKGRVSSVPIFQPKFLFFLFSPIFQP